MALPSLKKINLSKTTEPELYAQLSTIKFSLSPIILGVTAIEDQKAAVQTIDKFIKEKKIRTIPYPICIQVSQEDIHSQSCLVIKDAKEAPQFFSQKVKPLNLKENQLLSKVNLLQSKIFSSNSDEIEPILKEYTKNHKTIFSLEKQEAFFKEVLRQSKR
ncbi:MAG: hypothetical protein N4A33_06640 [Bacteriovoracaceae bacterium]|jgi:hypothetical protein|nr:hypothetical protein [Bacteriovoracaceae bacterium]